MVRGSLKRAMRPSREASSSAVRSGPGWRPSAGWTTDGLDLLAPFLVRYAEDGHVGDRRVTGQLGLDLRRVDVDATGDDHVALAVAEVPVAVGVEVADVADGEHALRAGGERLVPVLVVVEGGGAHPHVDEARLAGRNVAATLIEYGDRRAQPGPADRARPLQPLGRFCQLAWAHTGTWRR
jgi:hypothetical protein